MLESMRKEIEGGHLLEMSNKDDDTSVANVKNIACDLLLQHRVEQKFKTRKVCTLSSQKLWSVVVMCNYFSIDG